MWTVENRVIQDTYSNCGYLLYPPPSLTPNDMTAGHKLHYKFPQQGIISTIKIAQLPVPP